MFPFTFSEHVRSGSESFGDDQPRGQCSFTDHSGDAGGDRLLSARPPAEQQEERPGSFSAPLLPGTQCGEETQRARKGNCFFFLFPFILRLLHDHSVQTQKETMKAGHTPRSHTHTYAYTYTVFSQAETDGLEVRHINS